MLLQPVLDVIDSSGELPGLLSAALRDESIVVRSYRDVDEYLEHHAKDHPEHDFAQAPGCLVLKVTESGLEALDPYLRLKACRLDNPVIIVSRHASRSLAVASFKLRAFDFFSEPIETGLLISSIEAALRYQSAISGPWIPPGDVGTSGRSRQGPFHPSAAVAASQPVVTNRR